MLTIDSAVLPMAIVLLGLRVQSFRLMSTLPTRLALPLLLLRAACADLTLLTRSLCVACCPNTQSLRS